MDEFLDWWFLIDYKEIWDIVKPNINWVFHGNNKEEKFHYIDKSNLIIKNDFNSNPIDNKIIHIKIKMNSYNSGIKTNFHDKQIQGEGFHYNCLSMILIGSVLIKKINIIHKSFLKNVHTLLERKRSTNILKKLISMTKDKRKYMMKDLIKNKSKLINASLFYRNNFIFFGLTEQFW